MSPRDLPVPKISTKIQESSLGVIPLGEGVGVDPMCPLWSFLGLRGVESLSVILQSFAGAIFVFSSAFLAVSISSTNAFASCSGHRLSTAGGRSEEPSGPGPLEGLHTPDLLHPSGLRPLDPPKNQLSAS
jgi:hypothetical protein